MTPHAPLAFLLGLAGAAEPATTPSSGPGRLTRVVVFADRAEVTRRVEVRCESGRAEARFSPLPLALDPRTLRGEVAGKAKVIGASTRELPLDAGLDARAGELTREVKVIDARLRELDDAEVTDHERGAGITAFEGYLRAVLSEGIRDPKPDTKRWAEALGLVEKDRLTLAGAAVERAKERRQLLRTREVLERRAASLGTELGSAAGASPAPSGVKAAREVGVAIECTEPPGTALAVHLSYVIPGATWHPEYDLDFVADLPTGLGKGRARLTVGVVVQQSTGEDWRDVELTLSTSKPKLGSEAPLPAPLFLSGFESEEQKVLVQAAERRTELQAGGPIGQAQAAAVLEDRGQSFTLSLPGRATVASDGRPYWMPVESASTDGEVKLVATPKLRPYVYRVASFVNPAAHALVAGRVHTYRGGSYVGDTTLAHKGPGEPIEVSLGIDEELRVERRSLTDRERGPGFLGGKQHLEQAYRITVENRSKAKATVEVRENIPVSKDAAIEVELVQAKTTRGHRLDRERGFVTWSLEVPRGGRAQVDLAHVIHLPKDWKLR